MNRLTKLAKFAWFVLAYNVFVIVYGAFVRASGSGAGCGDHWPTCNGAIIPQPQMIQTVIEFGHRVSSAITIVLILTLVVWVWRVYPKNSILRWASGAIGFFIVTESLLGASLVLFHLVENNASIIRAISIIAHLINTFLLLGSLTLTAWWTSVGEPYGITADRKARWLFAVGIVAMMILGASGAIAALGDTLFPSTSLLQGFQDDISSASNYLVRLRVYHPGFAVLTGLYVSGFGYWLRSRRPSHALHQTSTMLMGLVVAQMVLGAFNVILLAPIWVQLVHLLITCLIWILFLLTGVLGLVSGHLLSGIREEEIQKRIHQPAT